MATDIENLVAARSAILAQLATTAARPNYSIDGQSVSYDALLDRLAKLNEALAAFQGPVEVETYGQV